MPVHTDLPTNEHYGEFRLAQQLVGMNLRGLHLWFNISWLAGVGEIDLIIWREQGGLFVCEVKSFGLSAIEAMSLAKIKQKGKYEMAAPHISVDTKMWKLQNQIQSKLSRRIPYMVPAVIWTNITAQDWRNDFDGDVSGLAEKMLFSDDLSSGPVFEAALLRVAGNPATGTSSQRALEPLDDTQQRLEFSNAILAGTQAPRARRSDIEKLRLLETKVASQVLPDVPVDTQSRVLYRGGPGTGKTYRLLQLGVNHSIAGRSVLYVCFNKTLASDIGRLFSLIPEVRAAPQFPWAWDVADLLKHISSMLNIDLGDARFHELKDWCALVQSELSRSRTIDLATFDLVLIDEVQDLEDWMLDFAFSFCAPSGSIAIAEGIGQQLYGGPGARLREYHSLASLVSLTRNFRNTAPTYKVASEMKRWAEPWSINDLPAPTQVEKIRFDRETGRIPRIEILYDQAPGPSSTNQKTLAFERHMIQEYRRLISDEIESLFHQCESTDLLVLVPQDTSHERRWAHDAIDALGIPFIDYTRTRNNSAKWSPFLDDRRRAPEGDMVRLCTYRSCRGLEGTRVLIFGLERSIEVARALDTHADSLLHIVLSRALVDCTVAIPCGARTQERTALEQAIAKVAKR